MAAAFAGASAVVPTVRLAAAPVARLLAASAASSPLAGEAARAGGRRQAAVGSASVTVAGVAAALVAAPVVAAAVRRRSGVAGGRRLCISSARRQIVVAATTDVEPAPTRVATAQTWEQLREEILNTDAGQRLKVADEEREAGTSAHTDAKVRYFGEGREKPRVTLYRDQAAWCPYCQKVWLLLEAKEVDYAINKVPMRSYGNKPDSFMAKVPRGLLPAIEIDGRLMTESLDIMFRIESVFFDKDKPMFPPGGAEREHAVKLLELERAVFGAWCGYLFRPEMPFIGSNSSDFESALRQMDIELERNTESPWFLPYEHPTIVDMQYVSHIERTVASALYYKGYDVRKRFSSIDQWLAAWEELPYYMATKSDYYTHCMDIPPQYGPPFPSDDDTVKTARFRLSPQNSRIPVDWEMDPEPRTKAQIDMDEREFNTEAAWALITNHEAVVNFSCRPAGQGVGDWAMGNPYRAELADPYAVPGPDVAGVVSALLRAMASEMLHGPDKEDEELAVTFGKTIVRVAKDAGYEGANCSRAAICLEYLRDRIGVPRDMSMPAAKILRGHLGEASVALRTAARRG